MSRKHYYDNGTHQRTQEVQELPPLAPDERTLRKIKKGFDGEVEVKATSEGSIVGLFLYGVNATALPSEVGQLAYLKMLRVNAPLEELPPSLSRLTELTFLSLGGFRGKSIPGFVGTLPNLKELRLKYNENLKDLPRSVWCAQNLESLHVEGCPALNFPKGEVDLPALRSLVWGRCQLTKFPAFATKLPALEFLSLDENEIDSVPRQLGKLKTLQYFRMMGNRLEDFPVFFQSFSDLAALDLSWNALSAVPECVRYCRKLQKLNLAGNPILAAPTWLRNLPELREANLPEETTFYPRSFVEYYYEFIQGAKLKQKTVYVHFDCEDWTFAFSERARKLAEKSDRYRETIEALKHACDDPEGCFKVSRPWDVERLSRFLGTCLEMGVSGKANALYKETGGYGNLFRSVLPECEAEEPSQNDQDDYCAVPLLELYKGIAFVVAQTYSFRCRTYALIGNPTEEECGSVTWTAGGVPSRQTFRNHQFSLAGVRRCKKAAKDFFALPTKAFVLSPYSFQERKYVAHGTDPFEGELAPQPTSEEASQKSKRIVSPTVPFPGKVNRDARPPQLWEKVMSFVTDRSKEITESVLDAMSDPEEELEPAMEKVCEEIVFPYLPSAFAELENADPLEADEVLKATARHMVPENGRFAKVMIEFQKRLWVNRERLA